MKTPAIFWQIKRVKRAAFAKLYPSPRAAVEDEKNRRMAAALEKMAPKSLTKRGRTSTDRG